jgi:hypothetical protein
MKRKKNIFELSRRKKCLYSKKKFYRLPFNSIFRLIPALIFLVQTCKHRYTVRVKCFQFLSASKLYKSCGTAVGGIYDISLPYAPPNVSIALQGVTHRYIYRFRKRVVGYLRFRYVRIFLHRATRKLYTENPFGNFYTYT